MSSSKQKMDFRLYSLCDKVCRFDVLMESYRQCRTNGGSPGCDGVTFSDIEGKGLVPFEPVFEADLNGGSYGYRPKRGAADAPKRIESSIKKGCRCVYDADLKGYFDNIPHDRLLEKIERRVSDKGILALLRQFLRAPVLCTNENGAADITKPDTGTPQGGVPSPLFANIYLNDFSNLITNKTSCRMISYADDFVILHRQPYTERQVQWFKNTLASEGLAINEAKTRVVDMRQAKAEFDFPGFTFKMIPTGVQAVFSLKWTGLLSQDFTDGPKGLAGVGASVLHRPFWRTS